MSLKDKAFEAIPKNGIHPEVAQGMFTEKVVKLFDAEEEIEKWKELNEADQNAVIEIGKINESLRKEIQTLVKLLAESKFTLNDCQSELKEMGYSEEGNTLKSVKKIKERITQTLKNYEK